jgi:hypothetical protein
VRTLPDLRNSCLAEVRRLVDLCSSCVPEVRRKSELSIRMVDYVCIYKGVQLKSKHQDTGTMIGFCTTAPSPVSSPSNILPLSSFYCTFISARKAWFEVLTVSLVKVKVLSDTNCPSTRHHIPEDFSLYSFLLHGPQVEGHVFCNRNRVGNLSQGCGYSNDNKRGNIRIT